MAWNVLIWKIQYGMEIVNSQNTIWYGSCYFTEHKIMYVNSDKIYIWLEVIDFPDFSRFTRIVVNILLRNRT